MNSELEEWNKAAAREAVEAMLACCGSRRWAEGMAARRPIATIAALSEAADDIWTTMDEADWLQAFAAHPRIGERKSEPARSQSASWSGREQAGMQAASQKALQSMAEANTQYEERFGFTFIVCATGKSADEMLGILERRLANTRVAELREAAEQQRQIMQLRLGKWLLS